MIKEGKIKPGDPVNILRENDQASPWKFVTFRTKTRKAKDNSQYQIMYLYIAREFQANEKEVSDFKDENKKVTKYEDIAFSQ